MRRACASLLALRRDSPNEEHTFGRVRHALWHAPLAALAALAQKQRCAIPNDRPL
jgi:hypothetical protein